MGRSPSEHVLFLQQPADNNEVIQHTADMKRATLTLAALLTWLITFHTAKADEVQAYYRVNFTGIFILYQGFGYTAPGGNFVSLVGDELEGAELTIDYRPAPGEDINNLFIYMQVPIAPDPPFFAVNGSEFTETSPGLFHYDVTTNEFNGTILPGTFELGTYSLVDGMTTGTAGQYLPGSGFYYTVNTAVPEPSTWTLLTAGGVGGCFFVHRRRLRAV